MTRNVDAVIESFRPLIRRTVERFHHETALARAVVMVVRALVNAAEPCTSASHEADKLRHPPVLGYHGLQTDDAGEPLLVLLRCFKCESTLAVEPAQWKASAGPRLQVCR